MAKKRKLTTKSTSNNSTQQKRPNKIRKKNKEQGEEEDAKKQQQLQQQQQEVKHEEDEEENEEEEEEEEEEFEEAEEELEGENKEEIANEDDNDDEENKLKDVVGGENEPIVNLLEPFSKDQLMMILGEAAENHPDVASRIRKVADEDPVHRKIFIYGLGWDTTTDTLRSVFSEYGEIEDCKAVMDKATGKSKGYGFIQFKTRAGAKKALKEPQKRIGNRVTSCQLAAVGVPAGGGVAQKEVSVSEHTQKKIFVTNVAPEIDPVKLKTFFAKFGEIEDGPLGLDKQTGKPRGFCLFVYKSVEGAKKALEEPDKQFEGRHMLHCQRAIDGPKLGKNPMGQKGQHFGGRGNKPNVVGPSAGGLVNGVGLMGQSVGGAGFNQGVLAGGGGPGLNPALGQALSVLLTSQGAGLGLNNLLGTLGGGVPGGYGVQSVGVNPSVMGGYGTQGGLQSAYPNQQGGAGRSHHGPYTGH